MTKSDSPYQVVTPDDRWRVTGAERHQPMASFHVMPAPLVARKHLPSWLVGEGSAPQWVQSA